MSDRRWKLGVTGALLLGGCSGAAKESAPASAGTAAAAEKGSPASDCLKQANARYERQASEPASIDVQHVLVKSAESRDAGDVKRSREEACLRALEARKALEGGASWDEVVSRFSDSPGAMQGKLGKVTRDALEPAFADAAFALETNQLSFVVESRAGFHLIVRTQ